MPGRWTLIDDSYNANPHSMGAAIETLRLSTGECWLVMGDMAELGSSACHWHAEIGRKARACGVARLFATGPLSAVAVDAFGDHGEHFADKGALLRRLQAYLHTGVICLVKGSRSAAMDQIVKALCPQEDRQGVHRAS